jgi:hypothetical protein
MNRHAPALVLVTVTALLLGYGRHPWSWVAGPVASLFVWALERKAKAQEPAPPAPANVRREPAPVD